MRFEKDTLIAALANLIILIFGFLMVQYLASISGIRVANGNQILITPISTREIQDASNAPESTPEPEILPGVFARGLIVTIANTDGDGLRIRIDPGLETTPLFLGADGEEFEIIDGPSLIDNRIWWNIQSVIDAARSGWAVQDYLIVKD